MNTYTDLSKLENSRNCLRRIARHDELQFSKDSIVNVMEKFVKTVNVMDDTILVPCRLMDRQVGDSTDIVEAPGKNSTAQQLTSNAMAHGKRDVAQSKNVHEFLSSSELFNLYNMLNALKNDLLWTGKDNSEEEAEAKQYREELDRKVFDFENAARFNTPAQVELEPKTECTSAEAPATVTAEVAGGNTTVKGHARRPSTASVASTVSVGNLSDSESELSNENDSGVEFEGNKSDNTQSSSAGSISSSENVCTQSKKAANVDKATELAKRCKRHLNGLYQCLEQMTEAANYLTARYQSDIGPV